MKRELLKPTDDKGDDFESALRSVIATLGSSSASRAIAISVVMAFVLTCLRIIVLARVYGYAAPNSDQGAKSLVTTWAMLSAGLAPLSLAIVHRMFVRETGVGALIGLGLGSLYGLFTGGFLAGGFCGACIGALTGHVLGRSGIRLNRNQAKLFFGTVVGAYAVLAIAGFCTPVQLVPVGEARLASERTQEEERLASEKKRLDDRLMSSGGTLPTRGGYGSELSPRSKEVITNYRRQHGLGTQGERNMRGMLEMSDEQERKLRE